MDNVPGCVIKAEEPERYARLFEEQKTIREQCVGTATPLWGTNTSHRPEIGWDAIGIWYARASALYFQSINAENPQNIFAKAFDVRFMETYSNREHSHYPPLVSAIYASVLRVLGSADPLSLQVLQFGILLGVIALFWKTQNSQTSSHWRVLRFSLFAFLPINAVFAYTLYADLWVIFFLLTGIHLTQRRVFWAAALVLALVPFVKTEGWFILLVTLTTWKILDSRSFPLWLIILPALSTCYYVFVMQAQVKDSDFYISTWERILNPKESIPVAIKILGYYLDVLFRPKLWGLLWPLTLVLFWKFRGKLKFAIVPTLLALVAIPVAFWAFPFGHKEIVLTGSNRAVWQLTPMIWLIWNYVDLGRERTDCLAQVA